MSQINNTLSLANGGFVSKEQMDEMIRRRILRDHFAGLAMQGLVGLYDPQSMNELIAHDAYTIADAMLKQREKK